MDTKSPNNSLPVGQSIVILDFGAQYTQLIARRIREQNVFSAVLPCNATLKEIKNYSPVGIVLSGAPWSVYDKDAPPADAHVFDLGVPVLGICYGLQFMTPARLNIRVLSLPARFANPVSVAPGQKQVTVTPVFRTSLAIASESEITYALVA